MGRVHALLVEPLERAGVDYMVTGGMAVAYYGRPRLTDDIDLVVRLAAPEANRFDTIFPSDRYEVPDLAELTRRLADPWAGGIPVVHRESALRAHLHPAHDALHDWGFSRRQRGPLGEAEAWFVPVEYLVVRKLDSNRGMVSDHHLEDVLRVVRARGEALDHAAIERLAEERSLGTLWRIMRLNAENPAVRSLIDPLREQR